MPVLYRLSRFLLAALATGALHLLPAAAQNLLGGAEVKSEQTTATLLAHAPEGARPGAPI